MGVSMKPGATALTVMLREAISMAIAFVRADQAGLLLRRNSPGQRCPFCATTEAILMMRPARARIMVASACWMQKVAPVIRSNDDFPVVLLHTKREAVAGDCGVVHENIQTGRIFR